MVSSKQEAVRSIAGIQGKGVLGITMADLYEADDDLYVAGLATYIGKGVFSLFRYTDNVKPKSVTPSLVNLGCKTAAHELMHMIGIAHCTYGDCLMNGSGHLLEDARIPHAMCVVCTARLKIALGDTLSLRQRMMNLRAFFGSTPGFDTELKEMDHVLACIQKATP